MVDENATNQSAMDAEPSFVGSMDMVLGLLSPLSLYSPKPQKQLNISEQKAEVSTPLICLCHSINTISTAILDSTSFNISLLQYMRESAKIRTFIECLISQTLTFSNVVTNNERVALTTLCQKVSKNVVLIRINNLIYSPYR